MTIVNVRRNNIWSVILVVLGLLLLPSILCNCYSLLSALAWSTRTPVWELQQYALLVLVFGFPLVYWELLLTLRKLAWVRWTLLVIGILSLLPFVALLAAYFGVTLS
jgi:hypothetical protein